MRTMPPIHYPSPHTYRFAQLSAAEIWDLNMRRTNAQPFRGRKSETWTCPRRWMKFGLNFSETYIAGSPQRRKKSDYVPEIFCLREEADRSATPYNFYAQLPCLYVEMMRLHAIALWNSSASLKNLSIFSNHSLILRASSMAFSS